jgi:hypothetical protein
MFLVILTTLHVVQNGLAHSSCVNLKPRRYCDQRHNIDLTYLRETVRYLGSYERPPNGGAVGA